MSLLARAIPGILLALLPSCSGSSGGGSVTGIAPVPAPRAMGSATGGGAGDALAASLLLSGGFPPQYAGRPSFVPAARDLEQRLPFHALAHLEVSGLLAGFGADLAGSARIERLAGVSGNSAQETLRLELQQLIDLAGAGSTWRTEDLMPLVFPWVQGDARLIALSVGAQRAQRGAWQTLGSQSALIDTEQVGQAMLARVLAASGLLREARGEQPGLSPDDGVLGLTFLQQALAMEETLLRSLFLDGTSLGEMREPKTYDPKVAPRYVPRQFRAILAQGETRLATNYLAEDRASDLASLASLLRAASELAWLAAPDNPDPELRAVLAGDPFIRGPSGGPIDSVGPTFQGEVQPILIARCAGCHSGPFPQSGFSIESFERVISGGFFISPAVVPGDHFESPLWTLLIRDFVPSTRPFAIFRMPLGGPFLPQADIDLIAEWIDGGAIKEPPPAPEPPLVGLDLARVLYRNLRDLHRLPETGGALHHRFVHDSLSGFDQDEYSFQVDARGTGAALSALATYSRVSPDPGAVGALLEETALAARDQLVAADGLVAVGYDLDDDRLLVRHGLAAQAAITAGLMAAGRVLGSGDLLLAGRMTGEAMLRQFFDGRSFVEQPGAAAARLTPDLVALVLDALRELVADGGLAQARAIHDRFIQFLLPSLVFAEFEGMGEVIGDGIPDTDGNGIPEPALAGDGVGLAPLLSGVVQVGQDGALPPADESVTWSRHILPLFRGKCIECHTDGASIGMYRVDTPSLARIPGQSGGTLLPMIVPGDPEGSLLYRKLHDRNPPVGTQMPQDRAPFDQRALQMVFRWISEGAKAR